VSLDNRIADGKLMLIYQRSLANSRVDSRSTPNGSFYDESNMDTDRRLIVLDPLLPLCTDNCFFATVDTHNRVAKLNFETSSNDD
jgi:hypothetical protein